jgi:hypothetical protein
VQGPGVLGWVTGTGFSELEIQLATLGVTANDILNVELWITQDGPTKGPLDCMVNDGSQLSLPSGTLWDTETPIPLYLMYAYEVQFMPDPDPPVVEATQLTLPDFPAESFFDVTFNEPVDETTAETPGNYAISGGDGGAHTVVTATRDATQLNVVHLEVSSSMSASTNLYTLTVTGVKDLANNTIVNDGVDNVACFMLKSTIFRGFFGPYLAGNSSPPDQFSIEGDIPPLTFGVICDTGNMADTGTDDIWEWTNLFHISGDCQAGTAEAELQWKFAHNCMTYEPLASNRLHTFSLTTGALDVLEFWWADEDPTQFTNHDIDVEFFVDMNLYGYQPGDAVTLNGSELPLTTDVPSLNPLVDDGSGNDAVPGDGIYSTLIRFPAGTKKDVYYKFLLNDVYECFGQGDRHVYLNDELYDIVGGALGPLTLPVAKYDRCTTIWRAVEVVFRVDLSNSAWADLLPGDVISVNGTPSNSEPATLNWDIPSINPMHDDGLYPDDTAGDLIFSVSIVLADSSNSKTDYKYLYNEDYECPTQANRMVYIDADNYDATGNPQVLPVDQFQHCQVVDVVTLPRKTLALDQNAPNPFNPQTEIHYLVPASGRGSLRIYNVRGELVRTLLNGHFAAGEGSVIWDGRTADGRLASSGVYYYRLEVNGQSDVKSMLLLK